MTQAQVRYPSCGETAGGPGIGLDPSVRHAGELCPIHRSLIAMSGRATFDADDRLAPETYDGNGNTIATGGKTFAYDSENHLTSMAIGHGHHFCKA